MKVLLISINNINEKTGGGIYLRTLTALYKKNGSDVDIFSKDSPVYKVRKNIVSDLIGRILGCPSYIGFYLFHILFLCRRYDLVAIHSTRLGLVARSIKFIYPNKKLVIHADNVESILIRELKTNNSCFKHIINSLDSLLMPFSERLCGKNNDIITFITKEDANSFAEHGFITKKSRIEIIPALLIDNNDCKSDPGTYLLFTGSFDFYPNQHALHRLINIAKVNNKLQFKVAGRKLTDYIKSKQLIIPGNMQIITDASDLEMKSLYKSASLFICPVYFGSGMKTKIAEALSFDLHVIVDCKSAYGYQKAVDARVVNVQGSKFFDYPEVNAVSLLKDEIFSKDEIMSPYKVFKDNYSIDAGLDVIRRVLQ